MAATKLLEKVRRIHQSSGEGALGMWVTSGMCPSSFHSRQFDCNGSEKRLIRLSF